MKPFTAYIALSAQGHPAWFIGYHRQRKELLKTYAARFGHTLRLGGYTVKKVKISEPT